MAKKAVSSKRAAAARAGLQELRKGGVTKKESAKAKRLKKILSAPRQVQVPGKPGSPGVRANQRDPFLSAEDQWDIGEELASWEDEDTAGAEELAARQADLPNALNEIANSATRARESQTDQATARGIFQSSINKQALEDIGAHEVIASEAAKKLVTNAQGDLDRLRNDIATRRKPRLFIRAAQRSIENAEDWNADQEWEQDPVEATGPSMGVDYDPKSPGIQNKQQANKNAAKRANQQPSHPGGGRGTQAPQPNRPGQPRVSRINRRLASGNLNAKQTRTLQQRKKNLQGRR